MIGRAFDHVVRMIRRPSWVGSLVLGRYLQLGQDLGSWPVDIAETLGTFDEHTRGFGRHGRIDHAATLEKAARVRVLSLAALSGCTVRSSITHSLRSMSW